MSAAPGIWLALATFLLALVGGVEVALGARRVRFLRDISPDLGLELPTVTIVVAARNEEDGIAAGLQSLLGLQWPRFEVIVVNDRSEDATGAAIEAVAGGDERVRVIDIGVLPGGWLGKTNALQLGARAGTGDWILFTDADVEMAPTALGRALSYCLERHVDHLAVTPELRMPTPLTDLFGGTFVMLFSRYAAPWKASNPRSRASIGIGAFNLVRRETYDRVGGHSRVALCPDDDMALGRVIKRAGFRQDVLYGTGEVGVEWYGSLREAIVGLEKNAFTGLGYSLSAVVAVCVGLTVFGAWPWLALLVTGGATRWLSAGAVAVMASLYLQSTRSSGANPLLVPALPLALLLFAYVIARSAALASARGHIRWRGTTYDLDELRANRC